MDYNVVITNDAENDLDRHIQYLLYVKKNPQAAGNVMDDYDETIDSLSRVAGSLKYCENPNLKKDGYKRINFQRHRYFMLFRIEENNAIVDNIFHDLEDFENKMM